MIASGDKRAGPKSKDTRLCKEQIVRLRWSRAEGSPKMSRGFDNIKCSRLDELIARVSSTGEIKGWNFPQVSLAIPSGI